MYAILDLEWKNTWKNDTNHDAVWIFCKFVMGEDTLRHIPLQQSGHEVVRNDKSPDLEVKIEVAADGAGLLLRQRKTMGQHFS